MFVDRWSDADPFGGFASTGVQSTIVQNGAPIAIDRCVVVLKNAAEAGTDQLLSEAVSFTNVSQRTATQVWFGFEIVDASGRTERTITGDKQGNFTPGIAIDESNESLERDYMRQTVSALTHVAKTFCRVQMVRFDDGSIWHEGDGPVGNSAIYTPLPGPSPTVQWQWPYDPPTP